MESVISTVLGHYENGMISRRHLVSALAAMVAAGNAARAAGFQVKALDHVSIVASNPQRSADFYKKVFGLEVRQPSAAAIAAGALNDGSVRIGLGSVRLVLQKQQRGQRAGIVDHFAFGVDPFDQQALAKDLNGRGVKTYDVLPIGFHVKDPDGVAVQFTDSK